MGRDLAKGKLTLPTIRALAAAGEPLRSRLVDIIKRHDRGDLHQVLEEGGWLDAARVTAADLVNSARQRLDVLPDSPARAMLHVLAAGVLTRRV